MSTVPAGTPGLFERIDFGSGASPVEGEVRWSTQKSLWWTGMLLGWIVLGTLYFSWSAVAVFLVLTAITLCLGHSLGMHRMLIHDSFRAAPWLERTMIYLGTLVGLGGPFTMMFTHDMRDWAQRLPACHDFLSHQRGILQDFWWQLHCKLHLARPPEYRFPIRLTGSPFYRFVERTWMLQQVPLALLLFAMGGWGWVAWGICGRVTASIFGHWLVGFFAHNRGHRDWQIQGAAVQGYNVQRLGLITFGECWHNNHHAFPGSAKLGLYPGLGLEIRSVNSRFLDLTFKLPDDLRGSEPVLRELLTARLKRGKVEVRAWIEGRSDASPRSPSALELQKLVGLQDNVRAWLPTAAPLSVAEVLGLTSRQQGNPGELNEGLQSLAETVGSSRVDLQACKLEYSIVSPK